jgi:hypothetical protein
MAMLLAITVRPNISDREGPGENSQQVKIAKMTKTGSYTSFESGNTLNEASKRD